MYPLGMALVALSEPIKTPTSTIQLMVFLGQRLALE
jgi:hypothetical protein